MFQVLFSCVRDYEPKETPTDLILAKLVERTGRGTRQNLVNKELRNKNFLVSLSSYSLVHIPIKIKV